VLLRILEAQADVISILFKALALFNRNLKASFPDSIAKYISGEIQLMKDGTFTSPLSGLIAYEYIKLHW
jgi:hypothetical protein